MRLFKDMVNQKKQRYESIAISGHKFFGMNYPQERVDAITGDCDHQLFIDKRLMDDIKTLLHENCSILLKRP